MSNIYKLIREGEEISINLFNATKITNGNILVLKSGRTIKVNDTEASEIKTKIEEISAGGGGCEEQIAALQEMISSLNEQILGYQEEIESLEEDITVLNRDKAVLNEQIRSLRSNIEELVGQINTLNSVIERLNGEKADLEEQIQNLNSEIENLNSRITELEGQIETAYNDGYEAGKASVKNLETLIDEFEDHPNQILLMPHSEVTFTAYPVYTSTSGSQTFTVTNDSYDFTWIPLPDLSSYERINMVDDYEAVFAIDATWNNFVSTLNSLTSVTSSNKPFYLEYTLFKARLNFTEKCKRLVSMFNGCNNLREADLVFPEGSEATVNQLFYNCTKLEKVHIKNFKFELIPTTGSSQNNMFTNCSSLKELNLENCDLSSITNGFQMFYGCSSLQSFDLRDLSGLTNASYMFNNCTSLQSLDLGDLSGLTDTSYMFSGCDNLETIEIGDLPNVTNANRMFQNCSNIESITIGDMTNCNNISYMFSGLKKVKSITIGSLGSATSTTAAFPTWNTLTDLKISQLPVASSVTLSLTNCPLNIESVRYIAATTGAGACTLQFNSKTKALEGFEDAATILRGKGYTVS